jgi:hypothetical protein
MQSIPGEVPGLGVVGGRGLACGGDKKFYGIDEHWQWLYEGLFGLRRQ